MKHSFINSLAVLLLASTVFHIHAEKDAETKTLAQRIFTQDNVTKAVIGAAFLGGTGTVVYLIHRASKNRTPDDIQKNRQKEFDKDGLVGTAPYARFNKEEGKIALIQKDDKGTVSRINLRNSTAIIHTFGEKVDAFQTLPELPRTTFRKALDTEQMLEDIAACVPAKEVHHLVIGVTQAVYEEYRAGRSITPLRDLYNRETTYDVLPLEQAVETYNKYVSESIKAGAPANVVLAAYQA